MSSLSKSKYNVGSGTSIGAGHGLNLYALNRVKDYGAKVKTVNLVNNDSSTQKNLKTQNYTQSTNSNSFRQTGILGGKKFKTTKSSPERYINDRHNSEDKSKLQIQNFMKNSVSHSVNNNHNNVQILGHNINASKHSIASDISHPQSNPIEEYPEKQYNVLDYIAKKIIKKSDANNPTINSISNSKYNKAISIAHAQLNSTNPVIKIKNSCVGISGNLTIGKCTPSPLFHKSSFPNNQTPKNIQYPSHSKLKISSTTPATNKNSRKNSTERVIANTNVNATMTPKNNSKPSTAGNKSSYVSINNSLSNLGINKNSSQSKQKFISVVGSTVKKTPIQNTQNSKRTSLSGSHNFSHNVKLSTIATRVLTSQSSKKSSKNNSKSTSRIDEKTETSRKKIIESEAKKLNIVNTKLPASFKKHLTSTNSPARFKYNLSNKQNLDKIQKPIQKSTNQPQVNYSTTKKVSVNAHTASTSINKLKEEPVKLNINSSINSKNNTKSVKSFNITNRVSANHSAKRSKEISKTNSKTRLNSISEVGGVKPKTKTPEKKKSNKNLSNKNSNKKITHQNNPNYHNTSINLDTSYINLDNSTSSIKSTIREANYYKKEAEKISNFIKQFYQTNGEYPQTSLKFYKFGRLLGRGAFGKVNLCLHTVSGRLVAVKSFNKSQLASESAKRKIFHETNLMKNLRHNSIVKIYEVMESPKYILIIMEYICGGDLLSFVKKRTKLAEPQAKFIFRQIIESLKYIHSQNIIHRDIKLDNILIDLGNNIKICDFGVSRQVKPGDVMHDQCGTPAYIAPEILKNQGYEGFGVDVWSAGVVLYAMLTGTVPFKATNMSDLHQIILSGNFMQRDEISSEAMDLINKILQVDPKKRLTTEEILNHEWLNDETGKNQAKSNINLFTNAERVLLSKSNMDYRLAHRDEIIENFTLKNLDTNQESENQNIGTKSYILAPFNSSYRGLPDSDSFYHPDLKIENLALKFCGKVREANRNYELNNNGEIDNGILIKPNNLEEAKNPDNPLDEQSSLNDKYNRIDKDKYTPLPSNKMSKLVSKQNSKPTSPAEKIGEIPTPKDDQNRNSRKNVKDLSMTNANTFLLDENVVKIIENIGYKKDYLLKCLYNNELNYATTTYYLFLNSNTD